MPYKVYGWILLPLKRKQIIIISRNKHPGVREIIRFKSEYITATHGNGNKLEDDKLRNNRNDKI